MVNFVFIMNGKNSKFITKFFFFREKNVYFHLFLKKIKKIKEKKVNIFFPELFFEKLKKNRSA